MALPLFIIPARGGSKGIPRKNIKDFCGKPLLCYSIDVAMALADSPERVLLSTDDEEILSVARANGLTVKYRRPAELATDNAGSREVMLDAMDWADAEGIAFDCVVLLQPTSPLRTAADVSECIRLYEEHDAPDMVVSVKEATDNPYYNCYRVESDGSLHVCIGDGLITRRQDAPAAYAMNGAVYVINPESLRRMPLGAFPRRIPYVMPAERSVDLDSPLDWIVAETVMRYQQENLRNGH